MNLKGVHSIYFLGIGGIGMSAIARYFLWLGHEVSGYDRTCTPLTQQLEAEGMTIHYDDNPDKIPQNVDLVVYTPAIPLNNLELGFVKSKQMPLKKRAEVLGMISSEIPTIAVAGTHGKTTVSSMIAHILKTANIEFAAFLGGISSNLGSNFYGSENPEYIVIEADEFDRSFLQLNPHIAVITSVEADHLDIYNSEEQVKESFGLFANKVNHQLIIQHEVVLSTDSLIAKVYTYKLGETSSCSVSNLQLKSGKYHWDFVSEYVKGSFELGMAGRHNVENAVAAAWVASLVGVSASQIAEGLRSYKGVKRRFEIHVNTPERVYVDDYAHHPSEIKACVSSLRELFPGRTLKVVFQPHLFSRTRDFADGFAQALEGADEIVLLDIYPARELPIPGISSQWLMSKIKNTPVVCVEKENLVSYLGQIQTQTDVLVSMGAGDIDKYVAEIIKIMKL